MMAQTHSRTSEAAVFSTAAFLMGAYPAVQAIGWLPAFLKDWLVVPAGLRGREGTGGSSFFPFPAISSIGPALSGPILTLIFIWGLANFAGQLADIDTPSSRAANSFEKIGERLGSKQHILLRMIFGLLNLIPRTISWFANTFMDGHRGIVHSLPFTLLISIGFGLVTQAIPVLGTPFYGTLFGVAFATHLLIDSVTRAGIKPLAPFSHWQFHLLPFGLALKSDSSAGNLVMQILGLIITLGALTFYLIPAVLLA